MLGHLLVYKRGLLSGQAHDDHAALVKGMAEYPTNTAHRDSYKTLYVHIGKARLGPTGGKVGRRHTSLGSLGKEWGGKVGGGVALLPGGKVACYQANLMSVRQQKRANTPKSVSSLLCSSAGKLAVTVGDGFFCCYCCCCDTSSCRCCCCCYT